MVETRGHPARRTLLGSSISTTTKIEEFKRDYTIVIVTHTMQQAARVSDFTAFTYLGSLIEFGPTQVIFTPPNDKRTQNYITWAVRIVRPAYTWPSRPRTTLGITAPPTLLACADDP